MWNWLNKQGVANDHGVVVQSVDRFTIEYREGNKTITVAVEDGIDNGSPCVIIEPTAFCRWDGNLLDADISSFRQADILTKFTDALAFQGIKVVLERRFG